MHEIPELADSPPETHITEEGTGAKLSLCNIWDRATGDVSRTEQAAATDFPMREAEPLKLDAGSLPSVCLEEPNQPVPTDLPAALIADPYLVADREFTGPENNNGKFKLIDSAVGVKIYQSGRDFIVLADLSKGAQLDLVAGDVINTGRKSVYGGPDPDFKRMSPQQALDKERKVHPNAMCVVNAEFFANFPRSTAPIAFPYKEDGKLISEGFATTDKHVGKRLTLEIGNSYAKIVPFDNKKIDDFRNIKESDAVVSLSPSVNIDGSANKQVGRTYLGLAHTDSSGNSSEVILFISSGSTQAHAEAALKKFGATSIMMFDGGNSSQFLCNNHHYVETTRTIPQYLSIIPAQVPIRKL